MNDLISRNIAIKAVEDLPNCYNGYSDTFDKACIIGVLEELAPIDAVQVVRCKDCKFSMSGIDKYNERYILCQLHERSYGVIDDGFCNWAEREEE